MSRRSPKHAWVEWYGSNRLRGKQERVRARRDLRRGIEPQPKYTSGKHWED